MTTFGSRVLKNIKKLSKTELENLLRDNYTQKSLDNSLINSISQAILLINKDLSIVKLNNAARRYVLKHHRYEGKNLIDVIANEEVKKQVKKILLLSQNTKNETGYIEFSIFEKKELIFGLMRFPSYNFDAVADDGVHYSTSEKVCGSILMLTEITQLKKMYSIQNQETSMASLNMLMAGIAHEIKNPLGALDLHLQLITRLVSKNEFPKKRELSDLLEIVKVEIARLDNIANDFLTHFRVEHSLKKEENINNILDHSVEVMLPRIKDRNISLEIKKCKNMKSFLFDKNQIHQLIINLLENAINAIANSDNKGKITLSTKNFSDKVILEVKDTGRGMDEEEIEKIFNPFYTSNATGTGLGLPIVSKITNHHNGKITVDTRINEGSTFRVIFYRTPQHSNVLQLEKK